MTDRRLLFVGLRHTLLIPYDQVQDVAARGKLLGARLIVSTPGRRHAVSGLAPRHAAEIAELVRADRGGLARHLILQPDGLEGVRLAVVKGHHEEFKLVSATH